MRRPYLLSALLLTTCTFTSDDQLEKDPAGPPLDERLAPGEVRAGVVTKRSELIDGLTANGRIGDVKLYNNKVGVVIAGAGAGRGYHPYGGVLLDAARTDVPGTGTRFGEVIAALDLVVLRGDRVEVVNDGLDGNAARVRVTGEPDVMPLFDSLLSGLFAPRNYDMDWTVDYVLEPDAEWVRLEYRVKNRGRETVDFGLRISAFMFGDGADPFLEGYGFDPPGSSATADYYAAIGDDVSYIYGSPGDRLNLVVSASGVVVTGHGDGFELIARETNEWTHYLVIGDGDLSKTQALWRLASGLDSVPEVSGTVVDATGQPVAGARIHAIVPDPIVEDRDYASRTKTSADGSFSLALPAGDYRLVATTDAGTPLVETTATVGPETPPVRLEVSVAGRLAYRVREGESPVPAKLSIRRLGDSIARPPARFGERPVAGGLFKTVFAHEGEGELSLPAGDYEVIASRGNEYEIGRAEVTIVAGETASIETLVVRSVNTPGWMSTDTHVHAQLSPDSPDLYPFKVQAMVVEGLELPVSTEHESIGDFNPAIAELGLEPYMQGIVGSEVTTFTYGHFNAFPLVPDPKRPGNGRIDWYGLEPGALFAKIHENPGQPFIQVNHPRSPAIGGYFSAMGYDSEAYTFSRVDYSEDFEGIEVLNGCGNGTIEQQPIRDWFAYLNQGVHKVGAASTDNHKAATGNMGYPKTYVRMPTDDPVAAKVEDFRAAFMAGRLSLSCGPFLTIRADEAEIGDTLTTPGRVHLDVVVEAPTWMDVDVVEVIVDGRIVETVAVEATGGVVRFDDTIQLDVPAGSDGWVAVSTRGDQRHGVWASNRPSFAVTNPIFLDRDGDGLWHGQARP